MRSIKTIHKSQKKWDVVARFGFDAEHQTYGEGCKEVGGCSRFVLMRSIKRYEGLVSHAEGVNDHLGEPSTEARLSFAVP